ncbi:hypothetical protein QFC20_001326 [Naganishia adeliensis]|uniref:Uncharacterized protein n=1 Tax=Naganishia adeliensis TaxID=92952 RepID=A0ACC2WU60_9TREE|nr:hypothetical protein QFC20_001326 [Naganishia adeliensis]
MYPSTFSPTSLPPILVRLRRTLPPFATKLRRLRPVMPQRLHRQRAQAAAQRQRDNQRRQEQVQQLVLERERALQRESRRRLLAQREYERHLEKKRQEQEALRAWYVAEREARLNARRRADEARQQREERGFVEFLDSSNRHRPGTLEPETQQAEAFSESEAEEDEENNSDAMDKFLNALFEGFALQREATPSVERPHSTTANGFTATENINVNVEKDASPSTATELLKPNIEATATEQSKSIVDTAPQNTAETLEDAPEPVHGEFGPSRTPRNVGYARKQTRHTYFWNSPSPPPSTSKTLLHKTPPRTAASDDSTPFVPALTYTSTNVPYHSHAQSLLGLLVGADAVENSGDEQVRSKRKEFVRRVEVELDALERRKGEVWKAQRV